MPLGYDQSTLYRVVTVAHGCEQLGQSRYVK